jgi:hypothetical protein
MEHFWGVGVYKQLVQAPIKTRHCHHKASHCYVIPDALATRLLRRTSSQLTILLGFYYQKNLEGCKNKKPS